MPEGRPAIPAELERRVKVEAGHRCAIPTCKSVPIEINHIEDWAKVQEHTFENLIALCPNCHARYTKGEIDRKAMRMYKANLGVVMNRYNDFERRILELFGEILEKMPPEAQAANQRPWIQLPGGGSVLSYRYLLADGLIEELGAVGGVHTTFTVGGVPQAANFGITQAGIEFINKWFGAEPLDD